MRRAAEPEEKIPPARLVEWSKAGLSVLGPPGGTLGTKDMLPRGWLLSMSLKRFNACALKVSVYLRPELRGAIPPRPPPPVLKGLPNPRPLLPP